MHRTFIAALAVVLAACGVDPEVEPDPDPVVDAGSDAGTDAGSDAGSDAGEVDPEPEPEPVRLGVLVVNETIRPIALHFWTGPTGAPVPDTIIGAPGTEHVPVVRPGEQAILETIVVEGSGLYVHFDGGRTSDTTSCSNADDPGDSWIRGIPFYVDGAFGWTKSGGTKGYGYAVLLADAAWSAETHAVLVRVYPRDTPDFGALWCDAAVSVAPSQ